MNRIHKKRLYFSILTLLGIAIAVGLILFALKQNINVFMTPSQLTEKGITSDYEIRLGGIVKPNSVQNDHDLNIEFFVTDLKNELRVRYHGVLPDLFREGKGVIAEGKLTKEGLFLADRILAKHDENYMPKNVYQSLRDHSEQSANSKELTL